MRPELATVSLFTGAGGLDIGLESAGFSTRLAVECDADACETLRLNRPRWRRVESAIEDISTRQLLRAARLRKRELEVLVGGPPCQPFSKAGRWAPSGEKRLSDPRAGTLRSFMRVVAEALPKAFLLENVAGFAACDRPSGLAYVRRACVRINRESGCQYRPHFAVLNAAWYGVPQQRERAFVVAFRDGRDFEFPQPTHGPTCREPYRVAWDAIGGLQPDNRERESLHLTGKWAGLLPSIPEGENYLFHTDRGEGVSLFGWRTRYWSFLLKLSKKLPSWTIPAQPGPAIGPFHWDNRRLARQELLRLQTFPDGYQLCGSRIEAQRQIGNAVPCLLSEVLGREIFAVLSERPVSRSKLKHLPARRHPVPRAHRRMRVASEYLSEVRPREPHPGTGRGPGAAMKIAS